MTGMVNGEEASGHARVAFAAPTGFGKSSACAAFLIAANQLGFLGARLSVVYAASRVSQLYDFESVLLNNGIPAADLRKLVSVLHGSKVGERGVLRASDNTAINVPILLITHERIRGVYRRAEGWTEKGLCYFLKFNGQARSMVLWDERCTTTEAKAVKVDYLRSAIANICDLYGNEPSHSALTTWLTTARESILQRGSIPASTLEQQDAFYRLVLEQSRRLSRDSFMTLRDFIESLRFTPRVIASQNNGQGIVHYKVTIPDQAARVLNLDASYGVSTLSQIGSRHPQGFIDAEEFCSGLKEMHRLYGKRLADLKDCSSHTFIHWNKGAGKEIVERDVKAYLEGKASGGNVILEAVEMVRQEVTAGKAVIVWTHAKGLHGADLQRSVEQCLHKAGLLDGLTVQGKPQVVVDHYGQHDAVNYYSYTQVAIHLGIMQRNECELAGSVCGESRNIDRPIDHDEVRRVKVTEKAVVLQQATGRSCSRKVVNGKCEAQTTYMIYPDKLQENLSAVLRPLFPGATWKGYRPRFAVVREGVMKTWIERTAAYLRETSARVSSRSLKKQIGAEALAVPTWTRIVRQATKASGFQVCGGMLEPTFPDIEVP